MNERSPDTLIFYVNGRKVEEPQADPRMTLLTYLRTKLNLTGTKLGCAEGGCGACTVMISRYIKETDQIVHYSINSCLAPVCLMHGQAVTTVEGIGSVKNGLHPVQERIAESLGSQCGFCTPGIVMSMYTLLRNNPKPSSEMIQDAFSGNLCRCTGYRPILDGFASFAKQKNSCPMGADCCRNPVSSMTTQRSTTPCISKFKPHDPSQEVIFPPELKMNAMDFGSSLFFCMEGAKWFSPKSLPELLDLKLQYPDAKLVVGNTEIGVEVKIKKMRYNVFISCANIDCLMKVEFIESGIKFGASCSLTNVENELRKAIESMPEYKTRIFVEVVEMLHWFAGHQIRNAACIAGNILTASPISDLNPLFQCVSCPITLASKDGVSSKVMDRSFFTGYRRTAVAADQILLDITIPFTKKNEFFCGFKQSQRKEDDIAIVNAGMLVCFRPDLQTVDRLSLSFGGVAPVTYFAEKASAAATDMEWGAALLERVVGRLAAETQLPADAPGGMARYRSTLALSFFYKFYLAVLHHPARAQRVEVDESLMSAVRQDEQHYCKSSQLFSIGKSGETGPVGRPIKHRSADLQATGEARYVDDMPMTVDELVGALVFTKKANCRLDDVDASAALRCVGVKGFISKDDVPGLNSAGPLLADEEIFVSSEVTSEGQAIGIVVADTKEHAQYAADQVQVKYSEIKQPVLTIKDAIEKDQFFQPTRTLRIGDPEAALASAEHVISGEIQIGGQEHFYLETQASRAVPLGEEGEMEVFSSCQNPTAAQLSISSALNLPANKINVRVKRIGGGFGGKETRYSPLLLPVAVAAHKMNRPVRCMLDRDEDMKSTGTRHPFLAKYKVAFGPDGTLLGLDLDLYCNAGYSRDLSVSVMERAMFSCDNCYRFASSRVTGYVCKTNVPSNTAFRGFGAPQGMLVTEHIIAHVAHVLGIAPPKVQELNMYRKGDPTISGFEVEDENIKRCWTEVLRLSRFEERQKNVELYNSKNKWRKRGIAIIPTKFGIGFTSSFLNQGGAFVNIYLDGSVLLFHGGMEMGQGLHTKMIQVASQVLRIAPEGIHISETSSSAVPNASPTAASVSSDINGMAVLNACSILMERLRPYIECNPSKCWKDWVNAAYMDRVSLSATGYYKTPGLDWNWDTQKGRPFSYFTIGAAVSEVEIDCLTGDHLVLRSDIVMDVGESLNPAVDIGQIEGAFAQGYGLFTLEEQRYLPTGNLLTQGPGAYKIPSFGNIPKEFNVSLLKESSNKKAVFSSKAVGEPPLFLASSVFFAIKQAIAASRASSAGGSRYFVLNSPATAERIRMLCVDHLQDKVVEMSANEIGKSWFINP